MVKVKLNWSPVYDYTESNVIRYAPKEGGVYRLSYQSGEKRPMFYVGQASDLEDRLLQHLSVTEPDECIKRHVQNYNCYFRYASIANLEHRNCAERALYDKYEPTCNDVAPPGPPCEINFEGDC